ncbi:MAG: ferritin-like domain-containing protein [Gemmatimonadota bacterium]|nr:ferritin-like domain-containing protein [Gemmatimonadota bacterium]
MTTQNETMAESAANENVSRRDAIGSASSKLITALGIGAIPIAMAALSRSAAAQTTTDLIDATQFVLLIVQMQAELHLRAASSSGFIPSADLSAMAGMRIQDASQVQLMGSLINSLSTVPNNQPTFDWTAKGAFPGFSFAAGQYATYQIIAHGLEDLGVRAIKGQIARMGANTNAMTQVATYASVQGRHAAEIRRIRGKKGWITSNSRDDLPAFFQPVYDGEEATAHAGFDSAALGSTNGGASAVTEAFDEQLTKAQANVILSKFLA